MSFWSVFILYFKISFSSLQHPRYVPPLTHYTISVQLLLTNNVKMVIDFYESKLTWHKQFPVTQPRNQTKTIYPYNTRDDKQQKLKKRTAYESIFRRRFTSYDPFLIVLRSCSRIRIFKLCRWTRVAGCRVKKPARQPWLSLFWPKSRKSNHDTFQKK